MTIEKLMELLARVQAQEEAIKRVLREKVHEKR
jgi:hypothetical protein